MFMLAALEDHVRVDPAQLGVDTSVAVENELKALYFDKVVPNIGLAVSLYDIQAIDGGNVHVGDGAAFFHVKFRLIVFRPFEGEVLLGRVHQSTAEGITVSLGFTEDVFIPGQYMQTPGSMYDEARRTWFWKFEGDELLLSPGEVVRFKAREVNFNNINAIKDIKTAPGKPALGTTQKPFQPMLIIGDINGDGLGCLSWWEAEDEEGDMEEES